MNKLSTAVVGLGAIFGVAAIGSAVITLEGPASSTVTTVSPTTAKATTTSGASATTTTVSPTTAKATTTSGASATTTTAPKA